MDDLVNVRMLGRDILEKTNPKNFQFHISVGTELVGCFWEPSRLPKILNEHSVCPGALLGCGSCILLILLQCSWSAPYYSTSEHAGTLNTLQYDAFSFQGLEMETDSAFDRSTLVEMHRLK